MWLPEITQPPAIQRDNGDKIQLGISTFSMLFVWCGRSPATDTDNDVLWRGSVKIIKDATRYQSAHRETANKGMDRRRPRPRAVFVAHAKVLKRAPAITEAQ